MWEPGLPAMALCQSPDVSTGTAPSQASQLPHLFCTRLTTVHRFNAPRTGIAHRSNVRNANLVKKILKSKKAKAPYSGALRFLKRFFGATSQFWHAPCNNPVTTQFRGPWYRQAENPLFTPGVLDANRVAPHTRFGNLGTGRPGIPSLTPKPLASPRFGSPGTGRPGTPFFTPGAYEATRP
ncbi:hypothetical protein ABMA08_01770 [Pseudomonas yamanorum]